ncbi:MAG: hypothetical protein AAFR96_09535 [Planctomycetota bacterium]
MSSSKSTQIIQATAAIITIVAVAVFIIIYTTQPRHDQFDRPMSFVCMEDEDNLHGFVMTTGRFAKHVRNAEPLECPVCQSRRIATGVACFSCKKLMPAGAHRLPPAVCPHCDTPQPHPNVQTHTHGTGFGDHGHEQEFISDSFDEDRPDNPQ